MGYVESRGEGRRVCRFMELTRSFFVAQSYAYPVVFF